MTPAEAIAMLDGQLAEHGEDCILRRKEGSPLVDKDVTVRALVRGLRAEDIVGTATQAWSKVVITMTQVMAGGWPSGHVLAPGAADPRIPRTNDFLTVKGKQRQIMFADPISIDGTVVRVNLTVAG
ncbi:hypothetical protein [Pseudaminobacter soli (ex Li et al. 2025)]|uniref:Uncharacterized protein n=1 Tax=Pseudaminobacter soli (ex Li et al. 2025) TaxID=1295366 RepID=A0A2P7S001_9HYPH|nr:hypothetical protein [Mesorhizobium soli]PSJ55805.1 hypothetical protein C7I85_26325 [Mesorhizobium soli]